MTEQHAKRVVIVVTHLLGVGHFTRMAALANALTKSGMAVRLVSGGRLVDFVKTDGFDLVQLPPVFCRDANFSILYDAKGDPVSEAYLEDRRQQLVDAMLDWSPQAIISELYPFGRKSLGREFEAVIAAAQALHPQPSILCSIRDVLNPPKSSARADKALELLGSAFDAVIVHGDRDIMPLETSWPVEPALERRLVYTGYLHDNRRDLAKHPAPDRKGVVVSAGGSGAGSALNRVAVEAAKTFPTMLWHVLVSRALPNIHLEELRAVAPPNVTLDWTRSDFPDLLASAELSISQAGYNTVLDLAANGPRAILVPFADGGEKEQSLRAAALERAGLAQVLPESELDAARLIEAVRRTLAAPEPDWSSIKLDGAHGAAAAIGQKIARTAARSAGWNALEKALQKAELRRLSIPVWLRDDDAINPTQALEKWLAVLERHHMPLALAAIPKHATENLAALVAGRVDIDVMVHGWQHRNHSGPQERAAEFGSARSLTDAEHDLHNGLERIQHLFGANALPVFVPPWNRIGDAIASRLPALGFKGLSTFAEWKPNLPCEALTIGNTHWDPIDWRGSRGLADEAKKLEALASLIDARAEQSTPLPIGLLTHHLVHDGWITRFMDEVLERLAQSGAVRFVSGREVFARQPA